MTINSNDFIEKVKNFNQKNTIFYHSQNGYGVTWQPCNMVAGLHAFQGTKPLRFQMRLQLLLSLAVNFYIQDVRRVLLPSRPIWVQQQLVLPSRIHRRRRRRRRERRRGRSRRRRGRRFAEAPPRPLRPNRRWCQVDHGREDRRGAEQAAKMRQRYKKKKKLSTFAIVMSNKH